MSRCLKRVKAIVLVVSIMIGVSACGKKETSSAPETRENLESMDASSQENNIQNDDAGKTEENEMLGMFRDGESLLILEEDGTFAEINAGEQYCAEGTYCISGNTATLTDNETGDKVEGKFENATWVLNGINYTRSGIQGSYSNEEIGDGIMIMNDNTFIAYKDFNNKKGKIIGTYERAGYAWKFISPGLEEGYRIGTFDGKQWFFDGDYYERTFTNSITPAVSFGVSGIYVDEKPIYVLECRVKNLSELGFTSDVDLEQTYLESGNVSKSIRFKYGSTWADLKVINTFENSAPLSECTVISFYTEDTTGTFALNSEGDTCGQELYDDLLDFDVYKYEPERLVYKKLAWTALDFEVTGADDPKGEQIIKLNQTYDLIYTFDGEVLTSFCYENSDYANGGLGGNTQAADLDTVNEATIEATVKLRDDILTQIKNAFKDTDIDIDINEATGEITMNSSILFEKDAYKLSDEGEAYLNNFFGIYAKVLLDEKFKNHIEAICFEGHTDSSGEFGYNKILSQKRAETVLDYCIHDTGSGLTDTEKDELKELSQAIGYASSNLVYDDNGKEDPDASRRVTVKFIVRLDKSGSEN